jgi:hypothetical protein
MYAAGKLFSDQAMRLTLTIAPLFLAATLFAANPPGVPKDARETAPGEYSFRDAGGKTWVYKQTPFGIQKAEDKGTKPAPAAEDVAKKQADAKAAAVRPGTAMPTPFGETRSRAAIPVTVTEQGDTLHFERQTPFGMQRWSKPKSDLTEAENQAWEAQRNSNTQTKSK